MSIAMSELVIGIMITLWKLVMGIMIVTIVIVVSTWGSV